MASIPGAAEAADSAADTALQTRLLMARRSRRRRWFAAAALAIYVGFTLLMAYGRDWFASTSVLGGYVANGLALYLVAIIVLVAIGLWYVYLVEREERLFPLTGMGRGGEPDAASPGRAASGDSP